MILLEALLYLTLATVVGAGFGLKALDRFDDDAQYIVILTGFLAGTAQYFSNGIFMLALSPAFRQEFLRLVYPTCYH